MEITQLEQRWRPPASTVRQSQVAFWHDSNKARPSYMGGLGAGKGSGRQWVLKVILGRKYTSSKTVQLRAPMPPNPLREGVVAVGVVAIREQGISTCRNICCNKGKLFSQYLRSGPLYIHKQELMESRGKVQSIRFIQVRFLLSPCCQRLL